jgi:serine/threonine protein kinase
VKHLSENPIPPSERTELEVPAELEEIILRCLEKDPDKRPRSAMDLFEDLADLEGVAKWDRESAMRWWEHYRPAPVV